MSKRVFTALIVCVMFLVPVFSAHADIIVTPNNDFYMQYQSMIKPLDRRFVVNTGAQVPVKSSPGAKSNIETLQAGTETYVKYSCLYDGGYWGFSFEYSGWVNLDQMLVMYDYITFAEEHTQPLYSYGGDYSEIKETRAAVVWPWPGAEEPVWTLANIDTDYFKVPFAYKDEDGREWGFVTYLYGHRNIWICLSDPLNEDLPALIPAAAPAPWHPDTVHTDISPLDSENGISIFVIVILVTLLVTGTGILIRVFWKPGKPAAREKHHN